MLKYYYSARQLLLVLTCITLHVTRPEYIFETESGPNNGYFGPLSPEGETADLTTHHLNLAYERERWNSILSRLAGEIGEKEYLISAGRKCLVYDIEPISHTFHVVCDYTPSTDELREIASKEQDIWISIVCERPCVCVTFSVNNYDSREEDHRVIVLKSHVCVDAAASTTFLRNYHKLRGLVIVNLQLQFAQKYNDTREIESGNEYKYTKQNFDDQDPTENITVPNDTITQRGVQNCKSNLTLIHLRENGITSFPHELFSCDFPLLTILLIENQNIGDLGNQTLLPRPDYLANEIFISLPNNSITHIRRIHFQGLHMVRYLDLRHNEIRHIERGTFNGMVSLMTLNMDNNPIHDISGFYPEVPNNIIFFSMIGSMVTSLPYIHHCNIRTLHLRDNNFTTFNVSSISQCTDLMILDFGSNHLSSIDTSSSCFTLSQTRTANFSHNALTEVEGVGSTIAQHMPNIVYLILSYNRVNNLTQASFAGVDSIQYLKLSYNNINSIDAKSFQTLGNLIYLSLEANTLTSIVDQLFVGLEKLQTLILHDNLIQNIGSTSFNGLGSSMNYLYISDNNITTVESKTFAHMSNLTLLNLDRNNIKRIANNSFPNKLQCLSLGDNQLDSLSFLESSSFDHLEILDVAFNLLDRVDPHEISNLPWMRHLYLRDNVITTIKPGLCGKMHSLSTLSLAGNFLTTEAVIENDVYADCTLTNLDLSRNVIKSLKYLLFSSLCRMNLNLRLQRNPLKYVDIVNYGNNSLYIIDKRLSCMINKLDLSFCQISHVSKAAFETFVNIDQVDLRANFLKKIPQFSERSATTFLLDANPVTCSCELLWLRKRDTRQPTVRKAAEKNIFTDKESRQENDVLEGDLVNPESTYVLHSCIHVIKGTRVPFHTLPLNEFICPVHKSCDVRHCRCWTTNIYSVTHATLVICGSSGLRLRELPKPLPSTAVSLDLSNNNFGILNGGLPWQMDTMILFLHNASLTAISTAFLSKFPNLRKLRLNNNKLVSFSFTMLDDMRYIDTLHLHNNNLGRVEAGNPNATQMLKAVTLHANNLSYFPSELEHYISSRPNIQNLTLGQNPWSCIGCNGSNLHSWLTDMIPTVTDLDTIQCVGEDLSFNGSILDLDILVHLPCQNIVLPREVHIESIAGAVAGVLLVVAVCIALVWHYRHHVELIYHMMPILRRLRPERETPADVFIMHPPNNPEVADWTMDLVINRLQPEGVRYISPQTLLMCGSLADIYLEAIHRCKRTVLLVTRDMVQEDWCSYVFIKAHNEVQADPHHRLIVVKFDRDLNVQELNPALRAYFLTGQYLDRHAPLFWAKFWAKLPPTRREEQAEGNEELETIELWDWR